MGGGAPESSSSHLGAANSGSEGGHLLDFKGRKRALEPPHDPDGEAGESSAGWGPAPGRAPVKSEYCHQPQQTASWHRSSPSSPPPPPLPPLGYSTRGGDHLYAVNQAMASFPHLDMGEGPKPLLPFEPPPLASRGMAPPLHPLVVDDISRRVQPEVAIILEKMRQLQQGGAPLHHANGSMLGESRRKERWGPPVPRATACVST